MFMAHANFDYVGLSMTQLKTNYLRSLRQSKKTLILWLEKKDNQQVLGTSTF